MPSDPTAEQSEIRRKSRQRLIGAVALALAAIVFVPMLLDPEPRRDRIEPVLAIPPKDGAPPLAPASTAPTGPASSSQTELPQAVKPAPPESPRTVEPKAAEFKAPAPRAPAPKPAPKAEEKPAPKLEGFAVQVGAFKDEARLAQAREKVVAARVPHYAERLGADQGDLTRLRAGPFPTREAADKAAALLKGAGLEVRVVPLP